MPVMQQQVILVDDNDSVVGQMEKLAAHQQGKLHRAFSVFIFRKKQGQTQCLLQQRQVQKYHSGGLWTNACCSHPKPGETVIEAAERRLQEELGFTTDLQVLDSFIYRAALGDLVEHEFDYVLEGQFSGELNRVNPEEVSGHRWLTVSELQQELHAHPERFTAWFQQALQVVLEKSDIIKK